jgi:hypothetical protein
MKSNFWLLLAGILPLLATGFLLMVLYRMAEPDTNRLKPAPTAPPATGPTTVLYNGTLGTAPTSQGYLNYVPVGFGIEQTVGTTSTVLDTTFTDNNYAGYLAKTQVTPVLTRTGGYNLRFTVRVESENHAGSDKNNDGIDDRAGFSVIVLSSDLKGIELGFWTNRIWAQNDGECSPEIPPGTTCFTQAEKADFNTTSLTIYDLTVLGNNYTLSSNGTTILTGPLRDYTEFTGSIDPYETPNFIFLGDDTTSARAKIELSYVAVTTYVKDFYLYVTSAADSASPAFTPVTLRQAVLNAKGLGGGTITFDPALGNPIIVTLSSTLEISPNTRLQAPACNNSVKIIANPGALLQFQSGVSLFGIEINSNAGPVVYINSKRVIFECSRVVKTS